jgi:hypothetical protein
MRRVTKGLVRNFGQKKKFELSDYPLEIAVLISNQGWLSSRSDFHSGIIRGLQL